MTEGFFWIRKQWSYGPGRWVVAERDEDGVFWLKGSAVADEKLEVGPEIPPPQGEDTTIVHPQWPDPGPVTSDDVIER